MYRDWISIDFLWADWTCSVFFFGLPYSTSSTNDLLRSWPVDSTPDSAKRAFSELHLLKIVAPQDCATKNCLKQSPTLNHENVKGPRVWLILVDHIVELLLFWFFWGSISDKSMCTGKSKSSQGAKMLSRRLWTGNTLTHDLVQGHHGGDVSV